MYDGSQFQWISLSIHLQEADGFVVEALRCVIEDALQCSLDNGAGSQNALA